MSHDIDLRRFISRQANLLQLLGLAVLIFLLMTALNPEKFLRPYNFESLYLPGAGARAVVVGDDALNADWRN